MVRVLILILLLLTGCATSTPKTTQAVTLSESAKEALAEKTRQWMSDSQRLDSVTFKILTKGEEFCKAHNHTGPYLGARFWSNQQLDRELRPIVLEKFNLGESVQLLSVVPSSPADNAGLQMGDKVIAVNGQSVQKPEDIQKRITESGENGNRRWHQFWLTRMS